MDFTVFQQGGVLMGYEVLKETPLSVEKMSNLDGIIWAVAPEYENASLFLGSLENLNDFDSCTGVWLDRLGQLVCLTRQQAGAMIGSRELADDDDIYRVCLKYKAFVNSCRCTPDEIIEATKIIFGATQVVYSERRDTPATIFLSISAPFSDMVMSILGTHDLIVRPAGVKVRVDCSTEDAETFWLCGSQSASCRFRRRKVCTVHQLTGGDLLWQKVAPGRLKIMQLWRFRCLA